MALVKCSWAQSLIKKKKVISGQFLNAPALPDNAECKEFFHGFSQPLGEALSHLGALAKPPVKGTDGSTQRLGWDLFSHRRRCLVNELL